MAGRYGLTSQIRSPQEAAQAFEGLLLKQLFGEMSKTVGDSGLFGSGFEGNMYADMFVDALAGEASKGGIGIAKMFEQSLGLEERGEMPSPIAAMASRLRAMSAYSISSPQAMPVTPVATDLASMVQKWTEGPAAQRWGKAGALTTADLGADITTAGKNGPAVFNVLDANGYEGHPKCNLFALELLRRAGYAVPVQARENGWGYPGADTVTNEAASREARNWAISRTQASAQELASIADRGAPLLLTGSGQGEVMGHMAVAERIHSVKRNEAGDIVSVEYSGWEAGGSKASYGRRTWHTAGEPGPGRGGLSHIEVLEARPAMDVQAYHPVDGATPGRSWQDIENRGRSAQETAHLSDVDRGGTIESDLGTRRDAP
jgi:Rod binding domain-containing protein